MSIICKKVNFKLKKRAKREDGRESPIGRVKWGLFVWAIFYLFMVGKIAFVGTSFAGTQMGVAEACFAWIGLIGSLSLLAYLTYDEKVSMRIPHEHDTEKGLQQLGLMANNKTVESESEAFSSPASSSSNQNPLVSYCRRSRIFSPKSANNEGVNLEKKNEQNQRISNIEEHRTDQHFYPFDINKLSNNVHESLTNNSNNKQNQKVKGKGKEIELGENSFHRKKR